MLPQGSNPSAIEYHEKKKSTAEDEGPTGGNGRIVF